MALYRSVKRHAGTAYLCAVTVGGLSLPIAALVLVQEGAPAVGAQSPGPVVTVTVGPSVAAPSPRPSASSPSAGAVGVHAAPTPRIVLVGTTPSVGLPPSPVASPPGPTVLPTPSALASGSGSPSPTSSRTTSTVGVTVVLRLVPHPLASAGVTIGALDLGLRLPSR